MAKIRAKRAAAERSKLRSWKSRSAGAIPATRGWWEGVVRITTPAGVGTGTYIAPDLILTAAHVIASRPGDSPPQPDRVSIEDVYGGTGGFVASSVRLPPQWTDNHADASLFDLAVIRPSQQLAPSLRLLYDFRTGSQATSAAAFGFAGSLAPTLWGTVKSFNQLLESTTIAPFAGMSGGPLIIDGDEEIEMVGVVCARAVQPGMNVTIALAPSKALIEALSAL